MINTPVLSNNNPYNRLLTAIEEMEKNETEQSQEQSNCWDDSNSILLNNSKYLNVIHVFIRFRSICEAAGEVLGQLIDDENVLGVGVFQFPISYVEELS